jgi:hypothetical protein
MAGSLVNEFGIPLESEIYEERINRIVSAKEDLFSANGSTGVPILVFRKLIGNSHNTIDYVMMVANGTDNEAVFSDLRGNNLSNEDNNPIIFTSNGLSTVPYPEVQMDEANINLLITGLPTADWRARTNLQNIED